MPPRHGASAAHPCETKVASSRAFSLEKSCCCYVQYVQYVYLSNRSLSVPGSAQEGV